MIEGYPVEFYDFKQSFENGLIFNAIIHRFNPNLVDFSILYPVSYFFFFFDNFLIDNLLTFSKSKIKYQTLILLFH